MLGGGGLLVGQAGLRLAQVRCLHARVTVQRGSRQHHGGLRQAALHEGLLGPEQSGGGQTDQLWLRDKDKIGATQADWPATTQLPVRLQRGTEEVLRLRHLGSGAESQLSLVCVLVLRLTLQRCIDGDRNLLHRCWLEKVRRWAS